MTNTWKGIKSQKCARKFISLTSENSNCPKSHGFYLVIASRNAQTRIFPLSSSKFFNIKQYPAAL